MSSAAKRWRKNAADMPDGLKAPNGYLILKNGVFRDQGDEGIRRISTAPFYVTGRLLNRERGDTSYIVELVSEGEEKETLFIRSKGGARAIARAVEETGVFLRGREVEEYINEYLAENWDQMRVTDTDHTDGDVIDPEYEPVYEQLIKYILENEEKFEDHVWGRFSDDFKTVLIHISVLNDFLSRAGITNKAKTLKYWENKGFLHVDSDGRHMTRAVRIAGHIQRAYVMTWPCECDETEKASEATSGLEARDNTCLADLQTGEVISLQITEDMEAREIGGSKISVKSPMGRALLGKRAGDVVKVEVEGNDVGEYQVV
jgi:phosphotransferase system HPr-like phosphotransfer protein